MKTLVGQWVITKYGKKAHFVVEEWNQRRYTVKYRCGLKTPALSVETVDRPADDYVCQKCEEK